MGWGWGGSEKHWSCTLMPSVEFPFPANSPLHGSPDVRQVCPRVTKPSKLQQATVSARYELSQVHHKWMYIWTMNIVCLHLQLPRWLALWCHCDFMCVPSCSLPVGILFMPCRRIHRKRKSIPPIQFSKHSMPGCLKYMECLKNGWVSEVSVHQKAYIITYLYFVQENIYACKSMNKQHCCNQVATIQSWMHVPTSCTLQFPLCDLMLWFVLLRLQ